MLVGGRPLLERDAEFERLRALLEAVREGSGALAVLTGPAGIGKTRLARALRAEAEEAGVRVLAARGTELEHDYAFGVVRQWFEPLLRAGDPDAGLEGAAALAAPVLAGDPAEGADPSFSVLHGLYWLAAGLAAAQPLALVLDDAQWSDEASLRFVAFLARRLDGLPVLLLLTAREPFGGLAAEIAADPAATVIGLRPLGPDAVAALLREHTAGSVDDAFALVCRDATGGNPFLLGELAQALTDEGVEFVAAERGRVPAVGPRSVATWVQLRLARLPAETTGLARAAAVAGDDSPLPLVAALAGLDEVTAAAAADELARAGVLEDARPLRFAHPVVSAAIRESLLAGERQSLHAHAAELLAAQGAPSEAIAVHLLALAPTGDREVAATLAEAARRATARGAPEAAATLLERALAEPPAPEALPGVLLALGEAEHALERPGAAEHLREAHRLSADPRERAQAALLLTWAVLSQTTEPRDVTELLERGAAELADADPDLALRLEAAWMGVAWDEGRLDDILARGERYAGLEGRTPGECLVLAHLAHAWMDAGRTAAEVAPLVERAATRELVPTLGLNSTWLIHMAAMAGTTEQLDLHLDRIDLVVAEAQRRGSQRAFQLAAMARGAALSRGGDVTGAEADAWAALSGESTDLVLLPAVGTLAAAYVEQGRLEEAERLLERYAPSGEMPSFRHATLAVQAWARLRAAQGDLRGALAEYDAVEQRLTRASAESIVGLDNRAAAATIRRALGDRGAEAEAEALVEPARRWGTPGAIGTALHALAVVRDDVELLREAIEALARSPFRLRHAKALLDLGSLLRRAGSRAESREPLREALALADELGGIAVRERAREELAASGVRVRREALSGADSLTPSERRIAERAAAGASNPEIAQALFVTVKTVEMHLSNAYRKLGISRRGELGRALAG